MATTVSYSASMRTRKSNSSSNFKSVEAGQEFYINDYNFVGIVHFSGLSLLQQDHYWSYASRDLRRSRLRCRNDKNRVRPEIPVSGCFAVGRDGR